MMQDSSTSSMTDLLALNKEPRLTSLLQPHQKIVASCNVEKFNEVNKCQERILLVTDLALCNVAKNENFIKSMMSKLVSFQKKYEIRRRIPIQKIEGISLSNQQQNPQFVIHVANQHGYRFRIIDYKTKIRILKSICFQYQKVMKSRMAFYFTDDITLKNIYVHKSQNKQKKIGKKIKNNPVFLNLQDLIDYELPGVSFQTLFCSEKQQKSYNRFKSLGLDRLKEGQKYYSLTNNKIEFQKIKLNFENKHPFISLPSYVYKTNSSLYFLRPLYIGGRMDKMIELRGALDKQMFTFYMAQLILALEYLHLNNWVYCDLRLQNIYIKANGYITLEGLNKLMTFRNKSSQKLFAFKGIDKNLAPQVIYCDGYDHRIDIWQLGICAFIMLKGAHPFFHRNKKEMFRNILEKQPIQNDKSIPSFLNKLLEKYPENRLKQISELKKDEFFEDIEWQKLKNQELSPPYTPQLKSVADWQGKMPSIVYIDDEK